MHEVYAGKCFICKQQKKVNLLKDFGAEVCDECLEIFLKKRVLSTIRSHHMIAEGDRVALGVSGGKDSITLLNILFDLKKRLRYELIPFHMKLGFGDFSEQAARYALEAAHRLGTDIKIYDIRDFGVRVEPVGSFPACAVCGALKRTIFNKIARELGANVLATAHTFDDMFLFAIKNIVSKKDNIPPAVSKSKNPSLPVKIKPMYRIPEYIIRKYCLVKEINHTTGECPVSDGRGHALKKVFEQIDLVSPSMRKQILDSLKRILKVCGKPPKEPEVECKLCGELSTQEICPLCRVREYQQSKKSF